MSKAHLLDAAGLPDSPIEAAAQFHAAIVPLMREGLAPGDIVLTFDAADHTHYAWRLAAVQALAREAAPRRRVNGVAGAAGAGREAILAFLEQAPGVTGQILQMDGILAESD